MDVHINDLDVVFEKLETCRNYDGLIVCEDCELSTQASMIYPHGEKLLCYQCFRSVTEPQA